MLTSFQSPLEAGEEAGGRWLQRAHLEAAMAAWDGGDDEAMARSLETSRGLRDDARWAWRWHQGQALAAQAQGDGETMVEHLAQALGPHRRRLTRFEAGSLWNDLGVGRAQLGDLAGSERAFLHAQRLLGSCQGPRRTTLTLYNLAEIRLRRGRLKGVREILEASTAENRLAGNLRGAIQDAELWARYEMVQGRFTAAAAHLRQTLDELESKDSSWRRDAVEMLLARALGLAGDAEAAAQVLERGTPPLDELEPEERPALWAQAGLRERALEQAVESGAGSRLWRDVLTGAPPAADRWHEVEELGEFRAARLILDLELASPGIVPVRLRRRAAGTLRRLGAAPSAARLEASDDGAWEALAAYQRQALTAASEPQDTAQEMAQLLTAAGYPEAQLEWRRDGAVGEPALVIKASGSGRGMPAKAAETLPEVAEAELPGGRLVLQATALDPTLAALFTVLVRDFEPPRRRRSSRRGGMVGESPALGEALERLERLAGSPVPVLIQGESGTGKELAARRVHDLSPRREGPFVALNCAALSENLVLSDLFGHVRGAFTGADRDRAGVFETARGGTVFLDEIGDLPLSAQGNLLRVLQEGEVRRLGESLPRKVDVRVVAATHHDLEQRVAAGDFRRDLFYRLRVALVTLPPLRDRGRDVILLAEHFLHGTNNRAQSAGSRSDPESRELTAAARARLLGHSWPGNVRELRNVLSVAVALAGGGAVDEEHLDLPSDAATPVTDYHQSLEAFRRRLVTEALEAAGGNRAEAARRLGMSRQALSYLVRQLRLEG
ncbi:MAG: sigma 54-interacting transcriptional regulator [Acidobacteriota bacterium]|nr:sigma 54-interacting transcriptional regulator [Acidobacteriota bacterium]